MAFLNIAAIVCIGLLTGVEFSVSAFVNPVLANLNRAERADAIQRFAELGGKVMPLWYVLSFVFLIVEAALHRGDWGFGWLIGATALWIVAILLSVLVLVPINNRMAKVSAETFTETAAEEHQRWDRWHRLRIAAIAAAFVSMLAAAVR